MPILWKKAFTHSTFTGFGNPSVNDDLALLHLASPLPVGMGFPTLGGAATGDHRHAGEAQFPGS